eukprot:g73284.t1
MPWLWGVGKWCGTLHALTQQETPFTAVCEWGGFHIFLLVVPPRTRTSLFSGFSATSGRSPQPKDGQPNLLGHSVPPGSATMSYPIIQKVRFNAINV